jgi:hypothetical protein
MAESKSEKAACWACYRPKCIIIIRNWYNLQHRLVECYVFIDDYLQAHPDVADWRRSNNDEPDFTDAEVLTIALMQGYFRTDTLKRTYQLVSQNTPKAFPERPDYKQWIRRLNKLTDLIGQLVRAAA